MNRYNENIKIRLERNFSDFGVGLWMFIMRENSPMVSRVKEIVFEDVNIGYPIDSCLSLDDNQLQGLMDDLWRLGFRPSKDVHGGPGEIEATKAHLNDMRKLVSAAYEGVAL